MIANLTVAVLLVRAVPSSPGRLRLYWKEAAANIVVARLRLTSAKIIAGLVMVSCLYELYTTRQD